MKIKSASLLTATETFLCQQCNCVAVKPHGLSATLRPNPYTRRRAISGRNCAVIEDRPKPGTIEILDGRVLCMYAQYGMGAPFSFNNRDGVLFSGDTSVQRAVWFAKCLDRMHDLEGTFAMPYKIGCGLAGGNWDTYLRLLESSEIADRITLYRLSGQ